MPKILKSSPAFSAKFRDIVVDMFGTDPDELTTDTTLVDDLGADSLDVIEFAMMLEEAYSIVIPEDAIDPEDARGLTLGQIADMVTRRGATL